MTDTLARIDYALGVQDAAPVADGDWMPGDPLYNPDSQSVGCARSMIDVFDDHAQWARCRDCQVSWVGPEPCWVCGVHRQVGVGVFPDVVALEARARASLCGNPFEFGRHPNSDCAPRPRVSVEVSVDTSAFTRMSELMRGAWAAIARELAPAARRLADLVIEMDRATPSRGPRPLCVDGHEYRRRTRSRRRRARR